MRPVRVAVPLPLSGHPATDRFSTQSGGGRVGGFPDPFEFDAIKHDSLANPPT